MSRLGDLPSEKIQDGAHYEKKRSISSYVQVLSNETNILLLKHLLYMVKMIIKDRLINLEHRCPSWMTYFPKNPRWRLVHEKIRYVELFPSIYQMKRAFISWIRVLHALKFAHPCKDKYFIPTKQYITYVFKLGDLLSNKSKMAPIVREMKFFSFFPQVLSN